MIGKTKNFGGGRLLRRLAAMMKAEAVPYPDAFRSLRAGDRFALAKFDRFLRLLMSFGLYFGSWQI
jgi:hypothetical protein